MRRLAAAGLLFVCACARAPGGPAPAMTSVTPDTHLKFPITTGPHAASCNTCHGDFSSFQQFTCMGCHAHDQPVTDELHRSIDPAIGALIVAPARPYLFQSASCLQCHASGGRVPYDHAGITSSCASCHDTGAPFVALPVAGVGLDGGSFVHPDKRGNDCSACHGTRSWFEAGIAPNGVRDPAQDVLVVVQVPSYTGTSITQLATDVLALPMPMDHNSAALPPGASSSCANCHTGANAGVFYPGTLHASLTTLNLAQPAQCLDCHAGSVPSGFVGPAATNPVRSPSSGEMKHDAVLWSGGKPTAIAAIFQDCSVCHQAPTRKASTWVTTQPFHASLTAAGVAQPASCLDCHANSRPTALLTSANAALPAGVTFDHGVGAATGDCVSCHAGATTSWSGGRQHLAGSATPATCLPCHAGERPVATTGWVNASFQASPFDYGTNSFGITHGAGQDCVACHANAGTGAWGGTQNWAAGRFAHGPATVSGTTCITCHSSQRPDLVLGAPAAAAALPGGFDHSINGTGDCFGCHQATVTANTYASYFDATGHLPGGDWKGGIGYPGSVLISASNQFITITETTLIRSGVNNLVTGTTSTSATLYNAMLHVSAAVPAQVSAGSSTNPDYTRCWHCHTNTNGTVTSYANGQFHSSLNAYTATPGGAITPLPQPTSGCTDCHSGMRPTGVVEKGAARLQAMDHDAMFVGGTSANQIGCWACHASPGVTWADGAFHKSIGGAVPQDCTVCHYSLMADAASADRAGGTLYAMRHKSGQITFQNCKVCHTTALANGTATPLAATLWQPGSFHANLPSQPLACIECHAVTMPAAATQSSISYTLAAGATATNQGQWMNHASPWLAGKDCYACHASDAKASGSAWSNADKVHPVIASPATCNECHGTGNGKGAVIGTSNNLPVGLTDSNTVTSAASDPTTGVPAGTHDKITHADVNVTGHDCKFCHAQAGLSTTPGIQGKEWAQASFHTSFTAGSPLVINGTTGRCSNCHLNVKPTASFTAFDHSALTAVSGSQDCASCHSWPGTGTPSTPNWLGASAAPQYITVGGFTIPRPPASTAMTQQGIPNLPHPSTAGKTCTACHTSPSGGRPAIGYDHATTLINTNCASCHEAGSTLVGTVWNGATSTTAGAGDTRPYTLPSVQASYKGNTSTETYPNHFFLDKNGAQVDCSHCHIRPAGNGVTTTGAAYTAAWSFLHPPESPVVPFCWQCHPAGPPP